MSLLDFSFWKVSFTYHLVILDFENILREKGVRNGSLFLPFFNLPYLTAKPSLRYIGVSPRFLSRLSAIFFDLRIALTEEEKRIYRKMCVSEIS